MKIIVLTLALIFSSSIFAKKVCNVALYDTEVTINGLVNNDEQVSGDINPEVIKKLEHLGYQFNHVEKNMDVSSFDLVFVSRGDCLSNFFNPKFAYCVTQASFINAKTGTLVYTAIPLTSYGLELNFSNFIPPTCK